jgi:hypothetical protein
LGGGWTPTYPDNQTMQTERTVAADDALFTVHTFNNPWIPGPYNIQTYHDYFLTAVNGGGKSTSAFHSDVTNATRPSWFENFFIQQCGDLGDGYYYNISFRQGNYWAAADGGGQVKNAISAYHGSTDPNTVKFKFIRQDDGTYALQTSNGKNYVTAIRGGGLAQGTATYDNLVTDRTQVQAWEKFRIVDRGNCTYTIQTSSGYFVGESDFNLLSTRVSDPAATAVYSDGYNYNAYFVLTPIWY